MTSQHSIMQRGYPLLSHWYGNRPPTRIAATVSAPNIGSCATLEIQGSAPPPPECHRSPVKAYNVRSNAVVHGAQDLRALGSRLITMMFLVRVARPSRCFSQDPKMGCASYTHTKAIRCFSVRVARPSRGFSQDPKMSSAACSRLSGRHSTMTKETPTLENSRFPV